MLTVSPAAPGLPLPMKPEGISKLKSGVARYKFICPKVRLEKNPSTGKYHRVCQCENPCSPSPCGRMVYIYPEKDLPAYPGALRGTAEWNQTYKVRTTVELLWSSFFVILVAKKYLSLRELLTPPVMPRFSLDRGYDIR